MQTEVQVPTGLTTNGLLGRRYIARFIDSIVILLILALVVLTWAVVKSSGGSQSSSAIFSLLSFCIWISYGTLFESSKAQATLGKRLMGLRVYDADGGRLSLAQALGRNLTKDGPFLAVALIPGGQILALLWLIAHLIVMYQSPVYQAIHDRVAHTWVAAPEETTQLHIV